MDELLLKVTDNGRGIRDEDYQSPKALSISVKTVGTYLNRILEKLNLKSNVELVKYALRHHLAD